MNASHAIRCQIDAGRRWLVWASLVGVTACSSAQVSDPERVPIRIEQVIEALHAGKIPLAGADVRLLVANTANTDKPQLEVAGVEPWGDRGARVRLHCEAQEQCLPFYVAVNWPDERSAKAALHLSVSGSRPQAAPVRLDSAESVSLSGSAVHDGIPADLNPKPAEPADRSNVNATKPDNAGVTQSIRAGARATLLIDAPRLHITVPVICLQNGAPGSIVKVTALDHKQTYLAEVIDSTVLKGTL